ncbi:MAG: metallophosphoesterase [Myxococcota bacterium]
MLFVVLAGALLVGVGLTHMYLYHRLFRAPQWRPFASRAGAAALLTLAVLMVVGASAGRWAPRPLAQVLAWVGFTWMGSCFYLLLTAGGWDLFDRGIRRLRSKSASEPTDPRRREVLRRAAVGAGGAAFGLTALGVRGALSEVEVRDVEVRVPRLPPALSGLCLVQMSDIHIGPTLGQPFARALAEQVRTLRPDLVAITGDLVDGNVPTLFEHVAPLGDLASRFGTVFVMGNHEYYSGAEAWAGALQRLGVRVLRNDRLQLGDGGGRVDLVGLEDWSQWRPEALPALRAGADPEQARIVLAHQPHSIGVASELRADLQISGHTHGGQFFPFSAMVRMTTPYVAGLYRHDARTQIYVSRGTGYWGPPLRLLAPAEITRIILVS